MINYYGKSIKGIDESYLVYASKLIDHIYGRYFNGNKYEELQPLLYPREYSTYLNGYLIKDNEIPNEIVSSVLLLVSKLQVIYSDVEEMNSVPFDTLYTYLYQNYISIINKIDDNLSCFTGGVCLYNIDDYLAI